MEISTWDTGKKSPHSFRDLVDLLVLYASMFIVMTGYGLTLTVLPFYIERMAMGVGATSKEISFYVGAFATYHE